MTTAKALREQRAKLVHQARAEILEKAEAEGRDLTAEERQAWDRIMGGTAPDGTRVKGEVDVLMERVERLERLDAMTAGLSAPAGDPRVGRDAILPTPGGDGAQAATEETRALALQAWFRWQLGHYLTPEQEAACRVVGLRPDRRELALRLFDTAQHKALHEATRRVHPSLIKQRLGDFRAALSPNTGGAGAYLIPPETLIRELEINLLYYGGVRQVAETMTTESGERMSWPTVDDTANKGRRLGASAPIGTGGQPASTGANDPTAGKVFWDAYKYTSDAVLVPFELLQDSAFNLAQVLGELLGIRLGRITNDEYTTGSGASMPKGLVTAATAFTAASSAALIADDFLGLYHSVDPAYRINAGFMMHDNTILAARKLKDGLGQYLWQPGLQQGRPDMLLGEDVTVNQSMDSSIASGKKTVLFGELYKYKIRRVQGMRLYRLEERYRDNDQDAFLAFLREDGNLLTAGTPPVKVLTHP